MSGPIEIALIGVGCTAAGATIKGAWEYVTKNRELIAGLKAKSDEHEISAWEQWRKDNTELRGEVAQLRSDISALRAELKEHERGRDTAEAECRRLQADADRLQLELDRTRAETAALQQENKGLTASLETTLRAQELCETAMRDLKRTNGKEQP